MGLWINQSKTKYIAANKAYRPNMQSVFNIGNYCFDRFENFTYLGSLVSGTLD